MGARELVAPALHGRNTAGGGVDGTLGEEEERQGGGCRLARGKAGGVVEPPPPPSTDAAVRWRYGTSTLDQPTPDAPLYYYRCSRVAAPDTRSTPPARLASMKMTSRQKAPRLIINASR